MNSRLPIRWRIAAWLASVILCVLAIFGIGAFFNLYYEQIEEVDLRLRGAVRRLTDASEPDAGDDMEHGVRRLAYEPWMAAAVFAMDGRLIIDEGRLPEAVARRAVSATSPETVSFDGRDWRVLSLHDPEQTLIVAYDLEEVDEIVFDLLTGFLVVLPVAVVIAAYGGWLVAGRALQPIHRATEAAAEITAARLDRRLPEPEVNDEIRELTVVINGMIERMERSFRQAERFTADASHELRTPLTIMKGEVERALRLPSLDQEAEARLVSVQEEIVRLHRLTEHLLMLARMDAGQSRPASTRVDLSGLVREVCADAELMADSRELAIDVDVPEGIVVSGDAEQLRRVVFNLLDNACRFSPPGGRVRCSLARERDSALLRVRDQGPGVPKENRERLFERFFRGDTARVRAGFGLGLSLSRDIVKAHGGEIHLASGEPEATEFLVVVPLTNAPG